MKVPPGTLTLLQPRHAAEALRMSAVAFGGDPTDEQAQVRLGRRIDEGEVYGWIQDGLVVGHCRLTAVDHWFGGRRVPTQHVASVVVPPEHRGRGIASALTRAALRLGARHGAGLSLLFPAANLLYRRLGYEQAGAIAWYRIETSRARLAQAAALRPLVRPAEEPAVRECRERADSALSGPAVRPADRWAQLLEATWAYGLDGAEGLDAYVLYDHTPIAGDWRFALSVCDWGATTTAGLRAVVAFIGSHGTVGKEATWRGPVPDPFSLLLPEQDVETTGGMRWMARGVDLAAAVAARGFPPGLRCGVSFAIDDPLLPEASGPWRLDVDGGEGRLVPASSAQMQLDVRAVGPLFTGFRTPADLVLAGLAAGEAPALARLGAAFAGPPPVLFDFF